METSDESERPGMYYEELENGCNIVTHCGIGRLVTQCFIESDNTGSFVFRPTKEKGLLVGTRDVELNDVENVSHELRFQTIESLENVINLLNKFRNKWMVANEDPI